MKHIKHLLLLSILCSLVLFTNCGEDSEDDSCPDSPICLKCIFREGIQGGIRENNEDSDDGWFDLCEGDVIYVNTEGEEITYPLEELERQKSDIEAKFGGSAKCILFSCADSQKDTDGDGVTDDLDFCPDTIEGAEIDENGCADSQKKLPDNPCETILPYTEQMAIDVALIDEFLSEQGITAQVDESGLRYVILEEGEGRRPTIDNTVNVKWKGTLLTENSLFEENTEGIEFPLSNLIEGWKIGVPLIKEGGRIILYIPSLLGYGCQGGGTTIPSNANLIYEVELIEII
jgi:FKBP-type peptidyl-prolyl cis-trans isomerase FkpA